MIHHGDLFDVLPTLAAESIDACVCDPPYGIGFMGREWDTFTPGTHRDSKHFQIGRGNQRISSANPNINGRSHSPAISSSQIEYDRSFVGQLAFEAWTTRWAVEVLRVLRPGAHILVCGAPRSFHRMTCGLEDAGFVVRDCLSWLYGQGFPKSLNLGDGRGTALKPGWEPVILARKPIKGMVKGNVAKHGTGALNIDACRIPSGQDHANQCASVVGLDSNRNGQCYGDWSGVREDSYSPLGRWPVNVVLNEEAAAVLEMAAGVSRFFYVAKPSRKERDYGCGDLPQRSGGEATDRTDGSAGVNSPRAGAGRTGGARNIHPTVKPVELMRWLVKLVAPIGGTVLDPFTGSGTTGMACRYEHRQFIGIEREAEYVAIAKRRIAAVATLFAEPAS